MPQKLLSCSIYSFQRPQTGSHGAPPPATTTLRTLDVQQSKAEWRLWGWVFLLVHRSVHPWRRSMRHSKPCPDCGAAHTNTLSCRSCRSRKGSGRVCEEEEEKQRSSQEQSSHSLCLCGDDEGPLKTHNKGFLFDKTLLGCIFLKVNSLGSPVFMGRSEWLAKVMQYNHAGRRRLHESFCP